jgi:hypothetical protein
MSEELTYHAMLIAWGEFAQRIGLVDKMRAVGLHQKTVAHTPQSKVLEFLVAILGGLEHLKDLSRAAHPLVKDIAVARAWGQLGWADHSGVSRCLSALSAEEVREVVGTLEGISRPILDTEVMQALAQSGELHYDGDLTGRPVSNTSTTYPEAAYGHMGDAVGFGYQAAMVSFHSPTYGRFWLSSVLHPGNVISCTQAEALVRVAEAKTGMRPLRRTDLLSRRIQQVVAQCQKLETQIGEMNAQQQAIQTQLAALPGQIEGWQQKVEALKNRPPQPGRRPLRQIDQAQAWVQKLCRRQERLSKKLTQRATRLAARQAHLDECRCLEQALRSRLECFERDNQSNAFPISAGFRLDAGFGTRDNLALLIEMGYQVYSKPYADWLTPRLKRQAQQMKWSPVGKNAEMIAWKDYQPADFSYPLDVGLERFYTGETRRYGTLVHFGPDPVTDDLPGWFARYNARQTIEAGIKEGKRVFQMHHLKVRSSAAIYLQEQCAVFAANFVRWAARWLCQDCLTLSAPLQCGVKELVCVAAHTSAVVHFDEQGMLLKFTDHSVYAGRSLIIPKDWGLQLPLPFANRAVFEV